tara:strand:- start:191 stop:517 length:327 start_codon:yes stop_codon:yes gene_type:complete
MTKLEKLKAAYVSAACQYSSASGSGVETARVDAASAWGAWKSEMKKQQENTNTKLEELKAAYDASRDAAYDAADAAWDASYDAWAAAYDAADAAYQAELKKQKEKQDD